MGRTALIGALAGLIAAALLGCSTDEGGKSAKDGGRKYKIAFLLTLDNPYWNNMPIGARDEAAKLGAEVLVYNAKEDSNTQLQQIQEAIAAVIYCSMSNTAQATSYQGLELVVVASVIVGGTPLGGGSGSLLYTLNGLLLLAVIENQLSQFGVKEEYRNLLRGGIMLAVVTLDVLVRRIRSQGRR